MVVVIVMVNVNTAAATAVLFEGCEGLCVLGGGMRGRWLVENARRGEVSSGGGRGKGVEDDGCEGVWDRVFESWGRPGGL